MNGKFINANMVQLQWLLEHLDGFSKAKLVLLDRWVNDSWQPYAPDHQCEPGCDPNIEYFIHWLNTFPTG